MKGAREEQGEGLAWGTEEGGGREEEQGEGRPWLLAACLVALVDLFQLVFYPFGPTTRANPPGLSFS